jgi:hypothetical protein
MLGTRRREFAIGLTASLLVAVFAFLAGPAPALLFGIRLGDSAVLAAVFATLAWPVFCGWMIVRFRWIGAISLIGAPLALAFPAYMAALFFVCATQNSCL